MCTKLPQVPARSPIGALAELAVPGWGGLLIDISISSFGLGVCTGYLIVFSDSAVELSGFGARGVWTLLAVVLVGAVGPGPAGSSGGGGAVRSRNRNAYVWLGDCARRPGPGPESGPAPAPFCVGFGSG